MSFKTFKRTMAQFIAAKQTRACAKDLTEEEARAACKAFNENRTPAQIKAGLKMEYRKQ